MTDVAAWAERVVEAVGWESRIVHVTVFLYDDDAGALRLVGQRWGAGEDLGLVVPGDWLVPLEGSICGWVYRSASPALVSDARHHPDYRPYPGGGASRSELAVPILRDGRSIGVVNVESPHVGAFAVEDVDALRALVAEAAAWLRGGARTVVPDRLC